MRFELATLNVTLIIHDQIFILHVSLKWLTRFVMLRINKNIIKKSPNYIQHTTYIFFTFVDRVLFKNYFLHSKIYNIIIPNHKHNSKTTNEKYQIYTTPTSSNLQKRKQKSNFYKPVMYKLMQSIKNNNFLSLFRLKYKINFQSNIHFPFHKTVLTKLISKYYFVVSSSSLRIFAFDISKID